MNSNLTKENPDNQKTKKKSKAKRKSKFNKNLLLSLKQIKYVSIKLLMNIMKIRQMKSVYIVIYITIKVFIVKFVDLVAQIVINKFNRILIKLY